MRPPIGLVLLFPLVTTVQAGDGTPIPDPDLSRHGMVGERFQDIMRNLDAAVHDTGSVESDRDRVTRDGMDELVEAAQQVMFFAEYMSLNPPRLDVGENQIATFRALASQLYDDALNIRDIARDYDLATNDFDLLNTAYGRMYQTCAACHELFRDY